MPIQHPPLFPKRPFGDKRPATLPPWSIGGQVVDSHGHGMANKKVGFTIGFTGNGIYPDYTTLTDQDGRFRQDLPASSVGYRVRPDVTPYACCPAYYDASGPCETIRFTCITPSK